MKGFYVHASNIHTGASEIYGPFPGSPGFTWELMRAHTSEVEYPNDHIFSLEDGPNPPDPNKDHWIDSEGDIRNDGWRRCYGTHDSFAVPSGPFWTDLSIDTTELLHPDTRWEANQLEAKPPQTTRNAVQL